MAEPVWLAGRPWPLPRPLKSPSLPSVLRPELGRFKAPRPLPLRRGAVLETIGSSPGRTSRRVQIGHFLNVARGLLTLLASPIVIHLLFKFTDFFNRSTQLFHRMILRIIVFLGASIWLTKASLKTNFEATTSALRLHMAESFQQMRMQHWLAWKLSTFIISVSTGAQRLQKKGGRQDSLPKIIKNHSKWFQLQVWFQAEGLTRSKASLSQGPSIIVLRS